MFKCNGRSFICLNLDTFNLIVEKDDILILIYSSTLIIRHPFSTVDLMNYWQFTDTTPTRLVGGIGPWEGRIEIQRNGHWMEVCQDHFNQSEAKIVCRMLGFPDRFDFSSMNQLLYQRIAKFEIKNSSTV